jgi:(2R)-ethylmalonyl-CoA mutase
MEVIYSGIRLTPAQIAAAARDEDPDVIGLSILSGSHLQAVATVMALLAEDGVDAPVIVGGIIPPTDQARLIEAGVAAVYTPKDYELARIMDDIVSITERHRRAAAR